LRELEKKLVGPDAPTNGIEAIGNRMSDAYFQLDPNKGGILREAIELIDGLFERVDTAGATADIMGIPSSTCSRRAPPPARTGSSAPHVTSSVSWSSYWIPNLVTT
jgi:hypothetical protein